MYITPEILIIEVLVEKGFAGSNEGMNTPDWGEI